MADETYSEEPPAKKRKRKSYTMSVKRVGYVPITIDCSVHGPASLTWKSGPCRACTVVNCSVHGDASPANGYKYCLACTSLKNARNAQKKRAVNGTESTYVSTRQCMRHPTCFIRDSRTDMCLICRRIKGLIHATRQRVSTTAKQLGPVELKINDVHALNGSLCSLCEVSVHALEDAWAPRGFSLGRIDSNITYTHENTTAQHWQCNAFQGEDTLERARARLMGVYIVHVINNGNLTGVIPPDPIYKKGEEPTGKRDVYTCIAARKRRGGRQDRGDTEHISREYVKTRVHAQFGKCYICGLLMGNDISFDQFIAGAGYQGDVRMCHKTCNLGKNRWPLATLLELATTVHTQAQSRPQAWIGN